MLINIYQSMKINNSNDQSRFSPVVWAETWSAQNTWQFMENLIIKRKQRKQRRGFV